MRLCIFRNLIAKYPQETDLDDIIRMMRNSKRLCLMSFNKGFTL